VRLDGDTMTGALTATSFSGAGTGLTGTAASLSIGGNAATATSATSATTATTASNIAGGAAGSLPYQTGSGATSLLGIGATNTVLTSSGTAPQWGTTLSAITSVSLTSAANFNYNSDTYLYRDAAGIVAFRNGANAQGLRVYNTYTDASNYERGVFDWTTTANTLTVGTQNGGIGTARSAVFQGASSVTLNAVSGSATVSASGDVTLNSVGGSNGVQLQNGGSTKWKVSPHLIPGTDVSFDIGSASFRPRKIYANRFDVPATITAGGTTGAQTINQMAGSVNFAVAAASLVVTDSLVTTSSLIFPSLGTVDATAVLGAVIPASGSFTINMKVAPTAETRVNFIIFN
jgi:hypothetical protein